MSDAINDMEAFTNLTDSIIYSVAYYPSSDRLNQVHEAYIALHKVDCIVFLLQAREILKKIKKREFYMFVDSTPVHEEEGLSHIAQVMKFLFEIFLALLVFL